MTRSARLLRAFVVVVGLAMTASYLAGPAAAATNPGPRAWLIADGVICDLFPEECPAIATADNGDTLTVQGSGTLRPSPKSADGGGTFVHKSAGGDVLGEGTWTVTSLVSFKSYGTVDFDGTIVEGGLALVKIHGVAESGLEFDGVMQIDCVLAKAPAGAKEGFRLAIQTFDLNFNMEMHGATLFVPLE